MMNRLLLQLALAAVALTAAFLGAAAATGFLCAALYLYLATLMVPALAALVTGLAAILAVFFILLAAYLLGQAARAPDRRRQTLAAAATPPDAPAKATQALLAIELMRILQRHPTATMLGALGAGLAVGLSPKLRQALRDILRD